MAINSIEGGTEIKKHEHMHLSRIGHMYTVIVHNS